jgi:type IV pilus assembly protein PilM
MSLPWSTLELTQPLAGLAGNVGALWNRTSPGWVGIDFGSSSIKLAQLEKQGDAWRLKNCTVLHLPSESGMNAVEDLPAAALAELMGVSSLGSTFSTQRSAAVASLGLLELRAAAIRDFDEEDAGAGFDAPEPTIGQETAQWEIPAHLCSPMQGRQVLSASMETTTVAQLAEGVAQLGLDLCTLDVLPTCLARGVALVSDATAATAVLDLGYGHPSLTLCQEGLPVYCRRLKRCGLGELLARLAAEFGLSQEECRALVGKFASCGSDARPSNSFLGAALDAWLRQLKSELIRTLEYLDSHRRDSFPEELLLCGGGATVAGIGEWLTDEVGIPARPWTLAGPVREGHGDQRVHPLFAAAAALSALAWEA